MKQFEEYKSNTSAKSLEVSHELAAKDARIKELETQLTEAKENASQAESRSREWEAMLKPLVDRFMMR
jgi:predicted RNase H-like nuclease (RuvC/YqgF family)